MPTVQSLQLLPLNVTKENPLHATLYHAESFQTIKKIGGNFMQKQIEQTLDSREVAEMIEKEHSKLLRDLRRYQEQFIEAKIGFNDFFQNSEYKDSIGRTLPCYRITKKGCEFIAHKLTGVKGTIFTARYINRFHEMQDILSGQQEPELPWFIRKFNGKYIMLFRDFAQITGVNLEKYKFYPHLVGGYDFNGWGWYTTVNKEQFKQEYGFDYGDDRCMMYFYPRGVRKALMILKNDKSVVLKDGAYKMLIDGLNMLESENEIKTIGESKNVSTISLPATKQMLPIQINIITGSGLGVH